MRSRLQKYLLSALLFMIPTQLAFHFWPAWAYIFGLRIDFLAPAVYLTDILIVSLIVVNIRLFIPLTKYILPIIVFAVLNIIFSTGAEESIYKWLKLFEFVLLGIFVAKQEYLDVKDITKNIFYSAVFFSIIGIAQFVKGGTLGGLLYWLGERSFGQSTPGIALISLAGVEHLRSYSTFSHPNSLAGFLGVIIIYALIGGSLKRNPVNIVSFFIISACFVLTFSVSAYFGLLAVMFFLILSANKTVYGKGIRIFFFLTIILSLFMPIFAKEFGGGQLNLGTNILERIDLAYMSGIIVSRNFWLGSGLGTFIVNIPGLNAIFTYSWLLQPVHNIYLLVFAETGIFGLVSFCIFIYKAIEASLKKSWINLSLALVFVIFTGLIDHYWLTLQQNILIFCVLAGISFRKS